MGRALEGPGHHGEAAVARASAGRLGERTGGGHHTSQKQAPRLIRAKQI